MLRAPHGHRKVAGLLHEAESAWEGAEGLPGAGLLRQLDRVLGHANRALELRPDEPDAMALAERATAARSRALVARERASRGRLIRRVAVLGLVLALAAAGIVALLLDSERRQAVAAERRATEQREVAEAERDRAEEEKKAKESALAEALAGAGRLLSTR